MLAAERQKSILKLLENTGSVEVSDLSRHYQVSVMTIRRDLASLEAQGQVTRTHGGAVLNRSTTFELSYNAKQDLRAGEKRRIGERAALLVRDGDTVILDAGTTTLEIAKRLDRRRNLTVVTNSLPIASELAGSRNIALIITGGLLRETSLSLVGPLAQQAVAALNADLAFIGVDGISAERGISTPDMVEAQTKRAMISAASRVVVVADQSKFGSVALATIAPIASVDVIVTDGALPADFAKALAESGAEVMYTGDTLSA
ncbi:MAG: DeoR/GlpR transcriptional regulator [Firmicutes bacterium]|nr:DeoR/GlpR transcriptional regulator [Bacillota bacterium]